MNHTLIAIAIILGLAASSSFDSVFADEQTAVVLQTSGFQVDTEARSILREAMEIADREDAEERTSARAVIGRLLRRLGLEAEFGNYGADAISAVEERQRRFVPPTDPKRQAEFDQLEKLEAEAKHRVLSGDLSGAQDIYMSAEGLRPAHEKAGIVGGRLKFLHWKVEAGDLSGALDLFKSLNLSEPWTRVYVAREIASALVAAGQRSKGLLLLRDFARRRMPPTPT
jgi:hypothetical protein